MLEQFSRTTDRYQSWVEEHPYKATTVEAVALYGVKHLLRSAGKKAGISIGNGHTEQHLELAAEHPLLTGVLTMAVSPVFEEVAFRGVATKVAERLFSTDQAAAVSNRAQHFVAAGFALTHVGDPRTARTRANMTLPLIPLISVEHYASIYRRRGLRFSAVAHIVNNSLAAANAIPDVLVRRNERKQQR